MQKENYPTRGQLERTLSQRIQALYRQEIGQQPSKVTCQLFDSKLAIVIENSITPAEKLLAEEGQNELAEQVRSGLEEVTKPRLKVVIEEVLGIKVSDMLSDSTLETNRTGVIAILDDTPNVRNPESVPKLKK